MNGSPGRAEVVASMPGVCAGCGQRVYPGERITPSERRWFHVECLPSERRAAAS